MQWRNLDHPSQDDDSNKYHQFRDGHEPMLLRVWCMLKNTLHCFCRCKPPPHLHCVWKKMAFPLNFNANLHTAGSIWNNPKLCIDKSPLELMGWQGNPCSWQPICCEHANLSLILKSDPACKESFFLGAIITNQAFAAFWFRPWSLSLLLNDFKMFRPRCFLPTDMGKRFEGYVYQQGVDYRFRTKSNGLPQKYAESSWNKTQTAGDVTMGKAPWSICLVGSNKQ